MSLSNFISQDIPILGEMFTRTEDQYVANLDDLGALIGTGNKNNAPSEIIIACKNRRRRVCGLLSEGVKIDGHSEWKEMFSDGVFGIGGAVVNKISTGVQAFNGTSIQQPWQTRRFWVSSKPFEFSFAFNFVTKESAKTDVFLPAQTLLSFTYPRNLGNSKKIKDMLNNMGFDLDQTNTSGSGKTATAAVIDSFCEAYSIPGPAIGYNAGKANKTRVGQEDHQGDAITITIGNMFAFGACYLQDVSTEFSPNVDYSGYPTWCKCTIKATAMDVNYCNTDGSFLISQYQNNQGALSDLVDAVKVTSLQAAHDALNIAKATTNAIGITHYKVD